jgi:CRP-like cAMP-binding protein
MTRNDFFARAINQLAVAKEAGSQGGRDLPVHSRPFRSGEIISAAGREVKHVVLICSGFAARESSTEQGGRFLTEVLLPLDFALLESLASPVIDCDLIALTDCQEAFIPHDQLQRQAEADPCLWPALFRAVSGDNGRLRSNLCNVARRQAEARLAHFFVELYHRVDQKGMLLEEGFDFPISQRNLGDLAGLSMVHINRTLQALRGQDLIRWDGQRLVIPSLDRLIRLLSGATTNCPPDAMRN